MDVKQEPLDSHEGVIKTEPGFDGDQNDSSSSELQIFKNDQNCASAELDNIFESQTTGQFVNVHGIKQETVEFEVIKIEHDSICENVQNLPVAIKTEVCEVKGSDIKHELSDYTDVKPKAESELLSTHCDLPTLKNENIDCPDYFVQPHSENTTKDVSKKKLRCYPCPVCQKSKYIYIY